MAADSPTLSVVVALYEDRGCLRDCIAAWVQQTCVAEAFEIVIASPSADSPDARAVRARLRPMDRFVHEPDGKEMSLYSAALARARGDVILFCELHCVPALDVVARTLAHFAHPDAQAASLEVIRVGSSRMARDEAKLSRRSDSDLAGFEPWRVVSVRGFAIRRRVLAAAGDLDPSFERFAEAALGARLCERGVQIDHIADARVHHQDSERWSDLAPALRTSGRGLAAYRLAMERGSVPRAVGPDPFWDERGLLAPGLARTLARAAWDRLLHTVKHSSTWLVELEICNLTRVLTDALATRALGLRRRSWSTRAHVWAAYLRWKLASVNPGDSARTFELLWSALLRDGLAQFLISHSGSTGEAPALGSTAVMIDHFPNPALIGFYGVENWSGEACRWSKPFAAIRVALEPRSVRADHAAAAHQRLRVTIGARSPVPVRDRGLWLGWDGEWIPPDRYRWSDESHVSFDLPALTKLVGAEHLLTFACRPFLPRSLELADSRMLGVAVFSLRIAALP